MNTGDDSPVDATGSGSGSGSGSGTDATPTDNARVYAHSGTMLYKVDPASHEVMTVGEMMPITDAVNDIAIDKDHHMVGIGNNTLYTIDPDTGAVLSAKALDSSAKGFSSLSYVPSATAGAADILVAANKDGVVYSINATAGSASVIGNYGTATGGDQIGSSGDIIGIVGAGIFATVDVGTTGATDDDYLATIDPSNGYAATLMPNRTGFNRIFGLAYWAGKIYGFVDLKDADPKSGQLIEIDPHSGIGTKVDDNAVEWYGAGVETTAPIIGKLGE